MEKIIINRFNKEKAYEVFQTGTAAFAETTDGRFTCIRYDDPARTGADGEYKWSECAFGNMLIKLLYWGKYKEIYIIPTSMKSRFKSYDAMIKAIKKNATHIIVKEEI